MTFLYSALDPGEKIGFADYDRDTPLVFGEIYCNVNAWEALEQWLVKRRSEGMQLLITEGYRNRPVNMTKGHANTWSDNLESQIVGFCRGFCMASKIEFVTQDPSIKPVGYGNAGLKYVPGKKGMHKEDALAHGMYWWINSGSKRQARSS